MSPETADRATTLAWRVLRHLLFAVFIVAASAILLFLALEIPHVNDRIGLDLPYYVMRRTYTPDSVLVFTSRFKGQPHRLTFSYSGDMYTPDFGVRAEPILVDVSYEPTGFRTNRSAAPYEIAVVGDSYIELSENDDNTFSEFLARFTGASTLNLGTAWYGPYQYVEVLERTLESLRPRGFALFMFYAGNDIEDIRQYERWRSDGRYHGHDRRYWQASAPRRFVIAWGQALERLNDLGRKQRPRLRNRMDPSQEQSASRGTHTAADVHPGLAMARIGDALVPMTMGALSPEAPADSLLLSDEWLTLRRLIDRFRLVSLEHGITPVIVYLPTKLQTYAGLYDASSGETVLRAQDAQRAFAGSQSAALHSIAADLGIAFVDLLPPFQARARDGELLYHPFDTHWNERGRVAAAREVARALAELKPED